MGAQTSTWFVPRVSLFLLLLAFGVSAIAEAGTRQDGNWWRTLTRQQQVYYVAGFFSGMDLGRNFAIWKYLDSTDVNEQKAVSLALDAYDQYSDEYFAEVTAAQIVDGLNVFYADYRNRRIETMGAIWLVVKGIAGLSDREHQELIESWRKHATSSEAK